jgi:hypothetical protein
MDYSLLLSKKGRHGSPKREEGVNYFEKYEVLASLFVIRYPF